MCLRSECQDRSGYALSHCLLKGMLQHKASIENGKCWAWLAGSTLSWMFSGTCGRTDPCCGLTRPLVTMHCMVSTAVARVLYGVFIVLLLECCSEELKEKLLSRSK